MEFLSRHTPSKPSFLDRMFLFVHRLPVSDSFIFRAVLLALLASVLWLLVSLSNTFQMNIPATGGTFTEGVVGTPRFVNPVLAVTRTDRDVSTLVFDGLMKLGADGKLTQGVAESVTVSDDGLTYNVILKNNITFQDGTPLTASDVIFTVGKFQEPSLASPLRIAFDGVTVEQIGDHELNFILPEPYAPFIENLTFGILPYHIWKDVTNEEFPFSQRNIEPIGSGAYRIENIERNASGVPESYTLIRNKEYHGAVPRIEKIIFKFFPSEEKLVAAFNRGLIDAVVALDQASLSTLSIDTAHEIVAIPLPRTFALFFNQNKSPALRDMGVRRALDLVIDRDALIGEVLGGYGTAPFGPIPAGFGPVIEPTATGTTPGSEAAYDEARAILKGAGWKLNEQTGIWEKTIDKAIVPLQFSIATVNSPVFEMTANYLQSAWKQLGIEVEVKQFEQSDLTQTIIRPRDYEALLFGTALGRSLDLYSFWHSSQRNDPGLNVALYANIATDAALTTMRTTRDEAEQAAALTAFLKEVDKEHPAIFLYSPKLLYVFPKRIIGATFTGLAEPQERFSTISNWYINTESVWPIFDLHK